MKKSKERELLEKTIPYLRNYLNGTISMKLADEIEELLKEPEPEPDIWKITKTIYNRPAIIEFTDSKPSEQAYKYYKVEELFLKRL